MVSPRQLISALAFIAAAFLTQQASAAIMTYEVHSTDKVDCGGASHGFWSGSMQRGGSCGAYYDFQPGSTLTVDTDKGKAVLMGTAINPRGFAVAIKFTWKKLTNFDNWSGMVKNGGGGDPSDWLFFAKGKGKIKFYRPNGKKFGKAKVKVVEGTGLQLGYGANDKTTAFGASSWITYKFKPKRGRKTSDRFGSHWDFNMNLKKVPEPGSMAILAIGLSGLVLQRRTRKHPQRGTHSAAGN